MGGPTYDLIVSQFEQCRRYADDVFKQLTDINGYLWKLSNAATGEMQELDMSWIEYDWPEPDIGLIPFDLRPAPPGDDDIRIDDVAVPELPSLREIELPAFPKLPTPDIPAWGFYEEIYTSEVLDRLKGRLLELSKSGSLGIPEETADAVFSQAKRRNEIGDAKLYEEALNFWAARGFILPPMMLAARLEDIRIEIERRKGRREHLRPAGRLRPERHPRQRLRRVLHQRELRPDQERSDVPLREKMGVHREGREMIREAPPPKWRPRPLTAAHMSDAVSGFPSGQRGMLMTRIPKDAEAIRKAAVEYWAQTRNPGTKRSAVVCAEQAEWLTGWKAIGLHLGVTESTARAWARTCGMPVRKIGPGPSRPVTASKSELDAWRRNLPRHVGAAEKEGGGP